MRRESLNVKGFGERALCSPTFHLSRLPFTILLSDARTPQGERRVSARQGWEGEKSDFFSILLEDDEVIPMYDFLVFLRAELPLDLGCLEPFDPCQGV